MKKLLLACLVAIAPFAQFKVAAEVPPAQAVGELMGIEMCNELSTAKTLLGDAAFTKVFEQLQTEYGEDADVLLMELGFLFSESPEAIANDPYTFEMFQVLFQYLVTDDDCFRNFLEYEVFSGKE